MEIRIIFQTVSRKDLINLSHNTFGDLVKAVVDVSKGIMAIGGELHADEEMILLEQGSLQEDLWGINLYPEKNDTDWIEFDSIINIRPSQNNRSRGVEDPLIQKKIIEIVTSLLLVD